MGNTQRDAHDNICACSQEDDVDRIVSSWHKERPDLDTQPMQVLSRLVRLARKFDLQRREAFASHDLDPWEFDVLVSLRRSGTPYALTPGSLMNELLVTSGTMTNRIDQLERKGFVTRSPSPHDRRAIFVTLTTHGKEQVDSALETLLQCEQGFLYPLSQQERKYLSFLLRSLCLHLEGDVDTVL